MPKVLGLDLGSNSIGWALIDSSQNKIIDLGVRIFPMGVNLEKGSKEISKNATRREKRQVRRQLFRRKLRKRLLVKELTKLGMFPKVAGIEDEIQKVRLSDELKNFFSINPYECRAKAYKGEKLTLAELGRIFYHLSQRRGYKESLQSVDENEGKIYDGDPKLLKTGITETKEKIREFGTLGNYLFNENPHHTRLRNRYTTRKMYIDEFEIIWNNQKKYHSSILTDEFKSKLGDSENGLIFFQRPLRSQKYLLGKCTFEPTKPRCPVSSIKFELFRMHQFINTIRIGEKKLDEEQRKILVNLFNSKDKFKFKDIKKKLNLAEETFNYKDDDNVVGNRTITNLRKIFGKEYWDELSLDGKEKIWNVLFFAQDKDWIENYANTKWGLNADAIKKLLKFRLAKDYASLSTKAISNILPYLEKGYLYNEAVLLGGIKNAFGSEGWNTFSEEERSTIEDKAIELAGQKEQAGTEIEKIRIFLKDGYNLSDKQLTKLYHHSYTEKSEFVADILPEPENIRNPIVQQALLELRTLVNKIIQTYGKPEEIKIEMARDLKSSKKRRAEYRFETKENEEKNDQAKKKLDEYGIKHTRSNIQKLTLWEECDHTCPYTGKQIGINDLFNEGYVQIEHIIPYSISLNDSIQNKTLCLADENRTKGDRTPFQFYGRDEKKWDEVKNRAYKIFKTNYFKYKRFVSRDIPDLDDFISRQLNDTRYISKVAKDYIASITPKVDVTQGSVTALLRHYWGLDTILNKTFEVSNFDDGDYYAAVNAEGNLIEILKWNYETKKSDLTRLAKKGRVIEGFISEGKLYPYKSRDDHRHHAIDALTVALTKRSYLQQIARLRARGYEAEKIKEKYEVPKPWENFFNDAEGAVAGILVSHKKKNKITTNSVKKLYDNKGKVRKSGDGKILYSKGKAARGQLHEESFFGRHTDPSGIEYFHITKPLENIETKKHINEIVDVGIRKVLFEHLKKLRIDTEQENFSIPKDAFFKYDDNGKKIPQVFLPNKNGEPIPIKKVRKREVKRNAITVNEEANKWVEPGNNDHLAIYENEDGRLKDKIVTFWEAVERLKNNMPVVDIFPKDGSKFVASFKENDMFLVGLTDEELNESFNDNYKLNKHLFRVRCISTTGYKIDLRKHTASGLQDETQMVGIASMKKIRELNPVKVRMSVLGKIERIYT